MSERKDKRRVPPRNVWLWWCSDCQCNRTRPCPEHHLLLSDAEVAKLCIKYTRGNVYGVRRGSRAPARARGKR